MGQLIYAETTISGVPDDHLAYLDAFTRHAFLESKSFAVMICGQIDGPYGVVDAARSLWFAPQIPVQFVYQGYETVEIRRPVFEHLYESTITKGGVYLVGSSESLPYEFTGESARDAADSSNDD